MDATNQTGILVTRWNGSTRDKAEVRGAVKVFSYANGVLKNRASIAANGRVIFHGSVFWMGIVPLP